MPSPTRKDVAVTLVVPIEPDRRARISPLCPLALAALSSSVTALPRAGLEAEGDQAAGKMFCCNVEDQGCRLIGFQDPQRFGIDHQDGVGGHLEEQAVACVFLPRSPVAPLQVLLRFDIALLDGRYGAQVASDGEHRAVFAQAYRGIRDRHVDAGFQRVVDLASARGAGRRDVLEQVLDLAARVAADRIHPRAPDPLVRRRGERPGGWLGDLPHHPGGIDHERDVAGKGHEGARQFGCPCGQRRKVGRTGRGRAGRAGLHRIHLVYH
jgi:hypothetical protein